MDRVQVLVDPVQDRVVTVGPPQVVALAQEEALAPVVQVLVDPVQDRVVTVGPPQVVALAQVEAPAPVVQVLVLDQAVTVGPPQVVALAPVVQVLVDPVRDRVVMVGLPQVVALAPVVAPAPVVQVLVLDQAVTVVPHQVDRVQVPVVMRMMIGLVRKISTLVRLMIRS